MSDLYHKFMVNVGKDSIMEHLGFVFTQIVANRGVFHFCEGLVEQTWKSRWLSASPSWGRWISSAKSLKPCGNLCAVFHGHQIPQTIIANIVGLLHRSRLLSKTFISQVWYIGSLENNWLLKFPWQMHGAGTFTYYFLPWKTNQTVGKYTLRPMDPSWDILHLPTPKLPQGHRYLAHPQRRGFPRPETRWESASHTKNKAECDGFFWGPTRKICKLVGGLTPPWKILVKMEIFPK